MATSEKVFRERAANAKGWLVRRLSDNDLFRIATHKYKGGSYTPIDNLLNPFWLWCSRLLPHTLLQKGSNGDGSDDFVNSPIAPNMVTLIGLVVNAIGYFLIAFETNFRMEGEIRPWVNVACGFTLFFYQTLDAMDGKHARRSRNGTPLGQLFDHGCDALSTPICSIVLCTTLQLGATPTLIYALMGSLIPFFMAQLAESRLGVLEHSIGGVLGVTETQIIAILIHISSAFLPMSFWTTAIGTVDLFGFYQVELQPNTLFVFGVLIPSGVFMVFTTMLSLPLEGKLYLELFGVVAPACILVYSFATVNTQTLEVHPYIVWVVAISLVYVTTQRIVFNMSKGNFNPFQPVLLVVTFGIHFMPFILQTLQRIIGSTVTQESYIQFLLVLTIVSYGSWVIGAISEICGVLQIRCLVPTQHKADGKRL